MLSLFISRSIFRYIILFSLNHKQSVMCHLPKKKCTVIQIPWIKQCIKMNYITRRRSEFQVALNFLNILFRMFNYITLQYSFSFQIHSRLRFFIQLQILNNQGQVSLELTSFFRFSSFLSLKATPFSNTIFSGKRRKYTTQRLLASSNDVDNEGQCFESFT